MTGVRDHHAFSLRSGSGSVSTTQARQQSMSLSRHEQGIRSNTLLTVPARTSRRSSAAYSRDREIPACDRCRSFKKKCSRTFPTCRLCANAGQKCSFSIPVTSDAAEVHHLRARLRWLTQYINGCLPIGVSGLDGVDTGTDLSVIFSVEVAYSPSADFQLGLSTLAEGTPGFASASNQSTLGGHPRAGSVLFEQASTTANPGVDCISLPGHGPGAVQLPESLPLTEINHDKVTPLDPPTLPRDAAGRRFVDAFFRNVNTAYPLVDRTSVLQSLESIRTIPFNRRSDADSTTLYLVMAIGCTTLQRAGQIPDGTMSKFDIAYTDIIKECLIRENIESVQILVLLSLHSLFDPNGISTWSIVGIVSRMALRLGFSRKESEERYVSSTEIELRRRLWWSVYVLDRMIAISMGLSVALVDKNMDVSLPGLTVDEFTSPEKSSFMSILQTNRHIIRMRQIEDQILKDVHLKKHSEIATLSATNRQAILQNIRAMIEDWYSHGCLLAPLEHDNVPFYDSITWQSARYHNLLVLLYYPCPFNSFNPLSTHKLLEFAQKHLQSTSLLLQQRQLPLNRVTLCRLLPIGLVLFHSLLSPTSHHPKSQVREESAIIIAILEAYPEPWEQAQRLAQIFRQFMAIISGISNESPLQFSIPSYGNIELELSKDLYKQMLRPLFIGLLTLTKEVLGSATCYSSLDFQDECGRIDNTILNNSGQQAPAIPPQRTTSSSDSFTAVLDGDESSMNYDWGPLELGFI